MPRDPCAQIEPALVEKIVENIRLMSDDRIARELESDWTMLGGPFDPKASSIHLEMVAQANAAIRACQVKLLYDEQQRRAASEGERG